MVQDAVIFIKEVGFPIFVALFTLLRMEGTMKKNTDALNMLRIAIVTTGKQTGGNANE